MKKKSYDKEAKAPSVRNERISPLRPENSTFSPLDINGIDTDISTREIVSIIREGRERH